MAEGRVTVDVSIDEDRTIIDVNGQRDAAVVVESDDEESIYLPPEDFDEESGSDPYRGPYEGVQPDDSPYAPAEGQQSSYEGGGNRGPEVGVQSTRDGFRIVHPKPVEDVRVLR